MIQEEREAALKAAKIIRCARKMNNLTQVDISKMLKVSQGTISKVESGDLILSSYHWMRFCEICAIPMETLATGMIESAGFSQSNSSRRIGKFQLPARYANNAGMKVRDFLPLLELLKSKVGEDDWKKYVKSKFKMDEDFFVNLDHQLSYYFVQDLLEEINNQELDISNDKLFATESFRNVRRKLIGLSDSPMDQIRFPDKLCRYLNNDFNLLALENQEGEVSFKYVAKKHMSSLKIDDSLAELYFKYKGLFFQEVFNPYKISLVESKGLEGSFIAVQS